MCSCNNRELEYLIKFVVLLLCLGTTWTIGDAHRMHFNRSLRGWFIGDCWSLWNCAWFCLCDQDNLSTKDGGDTRGHACWQWQKIFIIRLHSYRARIPTRLLQDDFSCAVFLEFVFTGAQHGATCRSRWHVPHRSLGIRFTAPSVPSKCLTSDDMFWLNFWVFFEGGSCEFVDF